MAYTFDGPNNLIVLPIGVTSIDVNDLYSRWVDWYLMSDNSKYLAAFRTVGGDPIGPGVYAGTFFFLENQAGYGWRIRPYEGNQELVITGDLYPEDSTLPMFVPTLGNYTVLISIDRSALTQQVSSGSGLTIDEHDTLYAIPTLDSILAEIDAVPAATPKLSELLAWLYQQTRNKITTTTTQQQITKDDGTVIGTSQLSDNGQMFTRDKYQ
jgi:hypothetical protein